MLEKDLLIFDLDGTLADTRKDIAGAVNHALEHLGFPALDLHTITSFVGDGITRLMQRALPDTAQDRLDEGLNFFHAYYSEHLADFSRPYAGVPETLAYFKNHKKAVFSNKQEEYTVALIERLGLQPYFDFVLGSRPGLAPKPEGDGIHFLCRQLSCPPATALMVGDNTTDILAGKAAGSSTCAVLYGYKDPATLLALRPDLVISSMEELKDFVKR